MIRPGAEVGRRESDEECRLDSVLVNTETDLDRNRGKITGCLGEGNWVSGGARGSFLFYLRKANRK